PEKAERGGSALVHSLFRRPSGDEPPFLALVREPDRERVFPLLGVILTVPDSFRAGAEAATGNGEAGDRPERSAVTVMAAIVPVRAPPPRNCLLRVLVCRYREANKHCSHCLFLHRVCVEGPGDSRPGVRLVHSTSGSTVWCKNVCARSATFPSNCNSCRPKLDESRHCSPSLYSRLKVTLYRTRSLSVPFSQIAARTLPRRISCIGFFLSIVCLLQMRRRPPRGVSRFVQRSAPERSFSSGRGQRSPLAVSRRTVLSSSLFALFVGVLVGD